MKNMLKIVLLLLQTCPSLKLDTITETHNQNFPTDLKSKVKEVNQKCQNYYEDLQEVIDNLHHKLQKNPNKGGKGKDGDIKTSQMQRNYQDLRADIKKLNDKLQTVKGKSNELQNSLGEKGNDKEKDNDIKFMLEDKIIDCDKDIKDIIDVIVKMVNAFIDNKQSDNEEGVKALILQNREIQGECSAIDDKIVDGKVLAEEIDKRLNNIQQQTIPQLKTKYEEKNELIAEYNDFLERTTTPNRFKSVDNLLADQLRKIEQSLESLNVAGPLINPRFKITDDLLKLRGDLKNLQGDMQECGVRFENAIQPLEQLGQREVKTQEIQKILKTLKEIQAELTNAETELNGSQEKVDKLEDPVKKLINIQDVHELVRNLVRDLEKFGDAYANPDNSAPANIDVIVQEIADLREEITKSTDSSDSETDSMQGNRE